MALEAFVNGKKKKTDKKVGETLRFELELVETSDEQSNEFFYPTLVERRTAKPTPSEPAAGGGGESGKPPPLDGEPSELEKMAAIARSFEEKYGPGPKRKKRRLEDIDLIDRGHGYDITDSFVDDSELYEDFVPPQVDTALGGFYINTGQLDFKCRTDLDPEESDFVMKKKKPRIKKTISHQKILATQKLKKAKQTALHKTPSKSGKKLLAGSGVSPLVKQVNLTKLKPEKKLKKSSKMALTSTPVKSIKSETPYSSSLSVPVGVGDIAIPVFDSATQKSQVDTLVATSTVLDTADQGEEPGDKAPPIPKEPPVLPESLLPPDVLIKVKDLEETIRWDQGDGKKLSTKTRSGYDDKLVEIELLCKAVTMKVRNMVFEFLAYKMGVAKGTLTKRIKAVLKKREDDELAVPLQKLKLAVEESMPAQMADYEEAKRIESLSSTSEKVAESEEETKVEDVFDESALVPLGGVSVGGASQPGAAQEAAKAKKTFVRKKYKWSDTTRKLLCDVVKVKVDSEERISRITRGNGEDIVMQFLEEKVRPLWPKGWMQKSVLYKVSELAHKHFTNPQPKKAILIKKEKPVTIKREPLDIKSTNLLSATSSTSSSQHATTPTVTPTTTPSTSLSRTSIPTDPKELVAFLLKDDKHHKEKQELIKKIVSQNAKLMDEKKNSPTQSTKSHTTNTISAKSAVRVVEPLRSSPKKATPTSTKVLKGSKVSISPMSLSTSSVSAASPSSVPPASVLKSSSVSTSHLAKVGTTSQLSLLKNSAVSQASLSKASSSGPPASLPQRSVPSLSKPEKKKKNKASKPSLSLTTSKDAPVTKKPSTPKTAPGSSPHMLTSTSGQPYILHLVNSPTGTSLLRLISTAQNISPSPPPSTAAPSVAATSDERLVFAGRSKDCDTQTGGMGSKVKLVQEVRKEEGVVNRIKGSVNVNNIVAGNGSTLGIGSSSRQQQLTSMTSVKTTPVIQLPRVSMSVPNSLTESHASVISNSSVTTKPSTSTNSAPPQRQPVLVTPSLSAVPGLPQVLTVHQPKSQALLGTGVNSVVQTVPALPSPRPASAFVSSAGQEAHLQESLQIPPLSKLTSPTHQTSPPKTRPLSVVLSQPAAREINPLPPLTGTTETPPQSSAHWLHGQQKEPSPLKSPVEQIMEEHSYLGSQWSQGGQPPQPLVLGHTPSLQLDVGGASHELAQERLSNVLHHPKE